VARPSIIAAALAGAAFAAACVGSAGGAPNAPAAGLDEVSMATSSWGRLMAGWTLDADGTGKYQTVKQTGAKFGDYLIVTRRLNAGPRGFARVVSLMQLAETHAGKPLDCRIEITDQPYAEIVWRTGSQTRKLDVNFGCVSPEAKRVYDSLDAAQSLVAKWAAAAPATSETGPASGR
jgi:hypothetical protein